VKTTAVAPTLNAIDSKAIHVGAGFRLNRRKASRMSRTMNIPPRNYFQIVPDGQKLMFAEPLDLVSMLRFTG
jgi:hypothetical protein